MPLPTRCSRRISAEFTGPTSRLTIHTITDSPADLKFSVDLWSAFYYILSSRLEALWYLQTSSTDFCYMSHLQNDLFAQTLRYARNFILGISIICLW